MFDSKLICKIPKCQNKDNEIAQENVGLFWISRAIETKFVVYFPDPKTKRETKIKNEFRNKNVILSGKLNCELYKQTEN